MQSLPGPEGNEGLPVLKGQTGGTAPPFEMLLQGNASAASLGCLAESMTISKAASGVTLNAVEGENSSEQAGLRISLKNRSKRPDSASRTSPTVSGQHSTVQRRSGSPIAKSRQHVAIPTTPEATLESGLQSANREGVVLCGTSLLPATVNLKAKNEVAGPLGGSDIPQGAACHFLPYDSVRMAVAPRPGDPIDKPAWGGNIQQDSNMPQTQLCAAAEAVALQRSRTAHVGQEHSLPCGQNSEVETEVQAIRDLYGSSIQPHVKQSEHAKQQLAVDLTSLEKNRSSMPPPTARSAFVSLDSDGGFSECPSSAHRLESSRSAFSTRACACSSRKGSMRDGSLPAEVDTSNGSVLDTTNTEPNTESNTGRAPSSGPNQDDSIHGQHLEGGTRPSVSSCRNSQAKTGRESWNTWLEESQGCVPRTPNKSASSLQKQQGKLRITRRHTSGMAGDLDAHSKRLPLARVRPSLHNMSKTSFSSRIVHQSEGPARRQSTPITDKPPIEGLLVTTVPCDGGVCIDSRRGSWTHSPSRKPMTPATGSSTREDRVVGSAGQGALVLSVCSSRAQEQALNAQETILLSSKHKSALQGQVSSQDSPFCSLEVCTR